MKDDDTPMPTNILEDQGFSNLHIPFYLPYNPLLSTLLYTYLWWEYPSLNSNYSSHFVTYFTYSHFKSKTYIH